MRKTLICEKTLQDELRREYILKYFLLICSGESGEIYGVEVESMDDYGGREWDTLEGVSEKRKEVEQFISRLWSGDALPVELAALYDDFISEKEGEDACGALLPAC